MAQTIMTPDELKALTVNEVLEKFSASGGGLSEAGAKERLAEYGSNEIKEKKVNPILKFLSYFWGPIPLMIEAAAALSAVIHHWEDFWIILALLLLNALVGFWQEYKADNAIELLKEKLALTAMVKRGGRWLEVPAQALVPGDVVRVRLGNIVPADLKLMDSDYLLADESTLTGESLPVCRHVGTWPTPRPASSATRRSVEEIAEGLRVRHNWVMINGHIVRDYAASWAPQSKNGLGLDILNSDLSV